MKFYVRKTAKIICESPPAWGRGLKFFTLSALGDFSVSPPAWGRGLKYELNLDWVMGVVVAPCVGAWVEINICQ